MPSHCFKLKSNLKDKNNVKNTYPYWSYHWGPFFWNDKNIKINYSVVCQLVQAQSITTVTVHDQVGYGKTSQLGPQTKRWQHTCTCNYGKWISLIAQSKPKGWSYKETRQGTKERKGKES